MESDQERRARLVGHVAAEMEDLEPRTGCPLPPPVAAALASVPRHRFVPPELEAAAYDDTALPIGHGQTISQPLIVALMTALLQPQPRHRILEVGTGSGYQAAVLASLVERVYTIEKVEAHAKAAAERLRALRCANVEVRHGDGRRGWPERAPFDGIVVTAAAPALPPDLSRQLAPGGRLVAPLGDGPFGQELWLFEKDPAGRLHGRMVLPVAFVPLV